MQITLLIPDLIPPPEMRDAALNDLMLPALRTLLARGEKATTTAEGELDGWLCRQFGVARQQDWPIAPVTLMADGGDPGSAYWLRADPVHLRATRDKLMLADSGAFSISQLEAEACATAFNAHFQADGMTLYPLRPDRWYLKLDHTPQLVTQPVSAVTGKHVDPYLPTDADGLKWHRLYNEIQMLFFSLPINDAREARGEMTINSLWLWGGGTLATTSSSQRIKLYANQPEARALALGAGCPNDALPGDASALGDDALVLLETLLGAAQYGDIIGWREGMQQLEADWFAPLLARLKAGSIKTLQIVTPGSAHTTHWQTTRASLVKLWRRGKLDALLG
jgi:Uncharacterized protein conserved in bacteria